MLRCQVCEHKDPLRHATDLPPLNGAPALHISPSAMSMDTAAAMAMDVSLAADVPINSNRYVTEYGKKNCTRKKGIPEFRSTVTSMTNDAGKIPHKVPRPKHMIPTSLPTPKNMFMQCAGILFRNSFSGRSRNNSSLSIIIISLLLFVY
jgi:hypothetical protein